MNERLLQKAISVVTSASLVACQWTEKLGLVTPPPEGTKINPTETAPSGIRLCGDGEPACPSDQSCNITFFHAGSGEVIGRSGVCENSNLTPEATLPVGTPSGIATEESGTGLGRTYFEIRFDPTQPCGQVGMPECKNMIGQPGWVENWHPDNQWPDGVIPIVDGYTYNEKDGLYYPNP